jgi:hypothetical protein
MTPNETETARVSAMLGLYKAEWLNGRLFELFNEPQYFGELKTKRPCVLIGGRGTGKTTVLRGLSYQGQFALKNNVVSTIGESDFYGIYYRVNTNRVTAFDGPELTTAQWTKYFAHYVNILFCANLLEFTQWYSVKTGTPISLAEKNLKKVATSLGFNFDGGLGELADAIELELVRFEASLNSIDTESVVKLSLQGAPIDQLTQALVDTPQFAGKQFFFLIDEFENLLDYQQKVLNTLIKHATSAYTFKVGVRELGWRERATLNPNEQLTSPADYARIDIADVMKGGRFAKFAATVISSRLSSAHDITHGRELIRTLLPGMSEDDEACLLLDEKEKASLVRTFRKTLDSNGIETIPVGRIAFAKYWARTHKDIQLKEALEGLAGGDSEWKDRLNNYYYTFLFTIRMRKPGIRKYYSGWKVFLSLANGNIRYLLEMVHAAFTKHVEDGGDLTEPIAPQIQTQAAQDVGKKNLDELQGLSVDGASLTKLLLSLGRIFQLFAQEPDGHTPEVTQFRVSMGDQPWENEATDKLLRSAVMHLALIRSPGNKLTDQSDTKEYDYMMHPVFAPFFVFSFRRKRKMTITPHAVLKLISNPRDGIADVLRQNNRANDSALPDQLQLFGAYYGKSSG